MTIKDVISLTAKGINLEQLKKVKEHENADDLTELLKNGMKFDDALEAVKLADQKPAESPESATGDDEEEEPVNEWEEKYNKLLAQMQKEHQRENNKNDVDEEAERKKHLDDIVRSFM